MGDNVYVTKQNISIRISFDQHSGTLFFLVFVVLCNLYMVDVDSNGSQES